MPSPDRHRVDASRLAPELLEGLVIHSNRGGAWAVQVDDREMDCALPGRLKHEEGLGRLAVGDRVTLRARLDEPERGIIEAVLPRRSLFGRGRPGKAPQIVAANVDQVAVVVACAAPAHSPHTIDRYLILAAACDIPALVVLNKADLDGDGEVVAAVRAVYGPLGVRLIVASAANGEGVPALRTELAGRVTAVIGPSGAGKSSLLNAASPGYALRTGEVMAIGKGRHTTTETTLLPLDDGGWVADTPGIKTLDLLTDALEPSELPHLFAELAAYRDGCHFSNCTHRSEPGCAVSAAAAAGAIAASRYESYVRLYDELEAAHRRW